MTRKKTKKWTIKRKRTYPLATRFDCPYCDSIKSCEAKLDRKKKVGFMECFTCHEAFQTKITNLSAPIDIYSSWVDALDETYANNEGDATQHTNEVPPRDDDGDNLQNEQMPVQSDEEYIFRGLQDKQVPAQSDEEDIFRGLQDEQVPAKSDEEDLSDIDSMPHIPKRAPRIRDDTSEDSD